VKILLSNDDGVHAPGIHQMAAALRKLGEVTICAPEGARSGASSALTIYRPLIVTEVAKNCWSVSGNPADAVKLAIHELLKGKPDIVVSGINNGLNTGSNVLYSGTVAAALEGAQFGITSFAVSRKFAEDDDYRAEAKIAASLIARLARHHPRTSTVFNINIPPRKPRGVQVTPVELTPYDDHYDRRTDPRGRVYYWLRGQPPRILEHNGHSTDDWAISKGFVTVSPLRRNLTDEGLLEKVSKLLDGRLRK
jgi:5'/3'-nucleotidase